MKPQSLPLISLIYADKTQNNKTTITSPPQTTCLSLRNNAACCIRLRDLRNLRENNTQEGSINIFTHEPQWLPQITQIYADKQQNNKTHTDCLTLRNNAAFCIPLRYLRYLRENKHIRVLYQFANMLSNLSESPTFNPS